MYIHTAARVIIRKHQACTINLPAQQLQAVAEEASLLFGQPSLPPSITGICIALHPAMLDDDKAVNYQNTKSHAYQWRVRADYCV